MAKVAHFTIWPQIMHRLLNRDLAVLVNASERYKMQIQVNTDDNVEGREDLTRRVAADILSALDRFSGHITRVEVHLSDENADKAGKADKRCLMEARPTGRKPLAVSHQGATLEEALSGATNKLQRALESTLGRLNDHKGGASIRTDDVLRNGKIEPSE